MKRGRQSKVRRQTVKEELECCDEKFEDPAVLASHKENFHMEKLGKDRYMICCDKKIFGTFKKHLEKEHSLNTKAEKAECCNDTFETYDLLTRHCSTSHGLKISQFKRVTCCTKSLTDVEEFVRHKEEDSGHIECNACPFLTKDESAHKLHMLEKHEECCEKKFEDPAILASHREKVHMEKLGKDRYMICCNKKIFGSLTKHLETEHSLNAEAEIGECCDDTFESYDLLTQHCSTNHGLRVNQFKRLVCCTKNLSDVEEFVRHKEEDSEHIECNFCPFLTKDDSTHKLHMLEKHEEISAYWETSGSSSPKYSCVAPECDKRFSRLTSLKSHIYRMGRNHNPAEKKYFCDDCGSLFKSIVAKRKHHRAEHQKVLQSGLLTEDDFLTCIGTIFRKMLTFAQPAQENLLTSTG